MVGQLLGQLAVVEAAPVGVAHPRAEVHLVDRHALVPRARAAARWAIQPSSFHSCADRKMTLAVAGGALGGLGERVGLAGGSRRRRRRPRTCSGARARPRGRRAPTPRRTRARASGGRGRPTRSSRRPPAPTCAAGRPHGERGAVGALVAAGVGAEHGPQAVVAALADQVDVEVAEGGPERPRVDDRVLAAAVPPEGDRVAGRRARRRPAPRTRRRRGCGASAGPSSVAVAAPGRHVRTTTWSPSRCTPRTRCGSRLVAGGQGVPAPRRGRARRVAGHRHRAASASVRRTADAGMSTHSGRCASS